MKNITSFKVSLFSFIRFSFIGVAFWTLNAAALPDPQSSATLAQFDETSITKNSVEFQPGVFRIEDGGNRLTKLCIPVNGVWKQVGDMHDCGNPPPPDQRREITQFSPDITVLGIRNLGINTDQWKAVQKIRQSGDTNNAFYKVGEAFNFNLSGNAVSWHFDSQKLPAELKTQIPGSGIHVHFGGLFSKGHALPLFDSGNGAFEVELNLSVPKFVHSGKAYSGLTVAVDLAAQTTSGTPVDLPVIVTLFSPNPGDHEALTSDGRVNYVLSYLGSDTKYVQDVENQEQSSSWSGFDRFAFELTRDDVKRILADANAHRRQAGAELLDENHLDQIGVSEVTLRNESRFLNEGDVEIVVAVDYLRIVRAR